MFDIRIQGYMLNWVFTLFGRVFHLSVVNKLWDIFFCFGDCAVINTVVAVFKILEPKILEDENNFNKIRKMIPEIDPY